MPTCQFAAVKGRREGVNLSHPDRLPSLSGCQRPTLTPDGRWWSGRWANSRCPTGAGQLQAVTRTPPASTTSSSGTMSVDSGTAHTKATSADADLHSTPPKRRTKRHIDDKISPLTISRDSLPDDLPAEPGRPVKRKTLFRAGTGDDRRPSAFSTEPPECLESPVSLVGLDALDDIDMTVPDNSDPIYYTMRDRLDLQDAIVPATFTDKRCEAEWARLLGHQAFDQLLEKT